MTTRDLPTVDVSLSRAKRRQASGAAATGAAATGAAATMASATTASAPSPQENDRGRLFSAFRFSAADVTLTLEDIEADLGYGRD